jgi:ethanolamine ammonia-lyase small subunit
MIDDETTPDPWIALRRHTPARLALGRVGTGLPTTELLRFEAAHAQARDAVLVPLDVGALAAGLSEDGWSAVAVRSRAPDRDAFLRRPDWGRRLDDGSLEQLRSLDAAPVDLAVVIGDGLSAVAVQRHVRPLLAALRHALDADPAIAWAPLTIATQARVALADEIGQTLQSSLALILIGERPGLSSPDSVGAYLTYAPRVGCHDAQRNCVSNIRPDGLPPEAAAARLAWLIRAALQRRLTGIGLKDDSPQGLSHRADSRLAPPGET